MTPQTPHPESSGRPGAKDEPEISFEESIPSDGKDPVGEKMIEELGHDRSKKEPPEPPSEPMPEQLPVS